MATREQYLAALRRANAAGDTTAVNELAAYIDANLPSAQDMRQQELDSASTGEQMAIGFGENVARVGTGVRNLIPEKVREYLPEVRLNGQPMFGDETQANVERTSQETSFPKTLGRAGSDLAMLALPASGPVRAGLPLARSLAAESALVAGYEGLKQPVGEDTRAGNAAQGAQWTAAGGLVIPGLGQLVKQGGKWVGQAGNKLFPIDDAAQQLLDEGVKLTPGQARPNAAWLEKLMSYIPGTSNATKNLQRESLETWNQSVMQGTSPTGTRPAPGHEGFQQLQDQFKSAYNKVWSGVNPSTVNVSGVDDAARGVVSRVDEVAPEFTGVANRAMTQAQQYWNQFKTTGDPRHLETLDDVLRQAQMNVQGPSSKWFDDLRSTFRNGLPPESNTALKEVDGAYRDFMTASRAGGYVDASVEGGVFTPRQLLGASKARSSVRDTSAGRGTLQPEGMQGGQVLGRTTRDQAANLAQQAEVPLLAAGAATAPVSTGGAITAGRTLVTPKVRDMLTGRGQYNTADLVSALSPGNAALALGSGTNALEEIERMLGPSNDPNDQMRNIARELRRSYIGR